LGFEAQGLGLFRDQGLGFCLMGYRCRGLDLGFRVWGLRCGDLGLRGEGLRFRVKGSGFLVMNFWILGKTMRVSDCVLDVVIGL